MPSAFTNSSTKPSSKTMYIDPVSVDAHQARAACCTGGGRYFTTSARACTSESELDGTAKPAVVLHDASPVELGGGADAEDAGAVIVVMFAR